ncbi:helix-turn-helix domain-containing protein [Bacillus sp. Hm123]|uniref:helix-turn-helix domain-containing protein n=1 Tax=Bacillus sp. Hm123 TaxID=3450745 RepID=UPI003F41D8E3
MQMTSFGERLRLLRKKYKLSQKAFGAKLGLAESTISMYERNERQPDYNTLEQIARFFEVSTDYLLTGKEQKNDYPTSSFSKLTEKDEKDIAKRMAKMKRDLIEASPDGDGLNYMGEPMSPEAIESLLEALEHAERIATLANKKYIPKKYRDED